MSQTQPQKKPETTEAILERCQISNAILVRDIGSLMSRGLDLEVELELISRKVEALEKELKLLKEVDKVPKCSTSKRKQ